jgi:hypothetical protein
VPLTIGASRDWFGLLLRKQEQAAQPKAVLSAEQQARLEREAEDARRADEAAFDARISAAECETYGHIAPDTAVDIDEAEIYQWGSAVPIRMGPRCTRCGAKLTEEDRG